LDQSGIEVDERGPQEVKREHGDLGVLAVRTGQVPALAVVQVGVARVPVLHHLQAFVDLAA